MVFVFRVDIGHMMAFTMDLTLESVATLKEHIERETKIPVEHQALLINGGQPLLPDARVCSYSTGTDTNPIYVLNKSTTSTPPVLSSNLFKSDLQEFADRTKKAMELEATYETIVKRAKLSQHFHEAGIVRLANIEKLIHEQLTQHQGWQAVVANLEDLCCALENRLERYQVVYEDYLSRRGEYMKILACLKDDLLILDKIPMLPVLRDFIAVPELEGSFIEQDKSIKENMTLLDFISSQNERFGEELYGMCYSGLSQFDENTYRELVKTIKVTSQKGSDLGLKEVSGLSERLAGLDKLKCEAGKRLEVQRNSAHTFQLNKNSADSSKKDKTILSKLNDSHLGQLKGLLENHRAILDYEHRCFNAKNELIVILHNKLQRVILLEDEIIHYDHELVFTVQKLSSLEEQMHVLQQVHDAPKIYLNAIAEVVRRRKFSQAFLSWADCKSCRMLAIHNEELTKRREFLSQFDTHFLSSLFPGMEDMPPAFATQAPSIFDTTLPRISDEDIEMLNSDLPDDLKEHLLVPDTSAMMSFFTLTSDRDDMDKANEDKDVEEKLMEVVAEAGLASNLDQNMLKAIENETILTTAHGLPHLRDLDKGCESETDTEEFEKVSQSPFEMHFDKTGIPTGPRPGTQDASTLTEVGEKSPMPPKKPPRTFQKPPLIQTQDDSSYSLQRTLSISGSQSNTESFTNIKNPSLESIDELSSLKNFGSNTESCFNSHHQQMQGYAYSSATLMLRSKSISPHTPQSPKDIAQVVESPNSPILGHQPNDFVNDEFYIDESLPSSLSIETGQSQGEFVKQLDTANNVVALLQDNLQISRSEYEKLQSSFMELCTKTKHANVQLQQDLSRIKSDLVEEKCVLEQNCKTVAEKLGVYITELENRHREEVQQLTVDHELEFSDYRTLALMKNEQLKKLSDETLRLKSQLENVDQARSKMENDLGETILDYSFEVEKLKEEIRNFPAEKEKAIKVEIERLTFEHKNYIETIKARFKLMERSPSESSLEKIDRGECASSTESFIKQLTDNFEAEKIVIADQATAKANEVWERKLNTALAEAQDQAEMDKTEVARTLTEKICEEKEFQIDQLRQQINDLKLESSKYKTTIVQLTDQNTELVQKIEQLNREADEISRDFATFKESTVSVPAEGPTPAHTMAASAVTIFQGKVDATTSPIRSRRWTESEGRPSHLNIDKCRSGDLVLVVWDILHNQFKILQRGATLYFLHSDYMESLGLRMENDQPNRLYCFGEVIDKEFCHARKPGNRFRVPKGTKFFRVKVKPVPGMPGEPQDALLEESTAAQPDGDMSQSQTVSSASALEFVPSETSSLSLPTSPGKNDETVVASENLAASSVVEENQSPTEPSERAPSEEETTANVDPDETLERSEDQVVERATELTENFSVHTSIDRYLRKPPKTTFNDSSILPEQQIEDLAEG